MLSVVVDVGGTDIVDSSSVRNRVEVALRRSGISVVDASVLSVVTFAIKISTLRPVPAAVSGSIHIALFRNAFVGTTSAWRSLHRDSMSTSFGDTVETAGDMWVAMTMGVMARLEQVTVWSDGTIFTSSTTDARSLIFDTIDRLMDSFINDYLKGQSTVTVTGLNGPVIPRSSTPQTPAKQYERETRYSDQGLVVVVRLSERLNRYSSKQKRMGPKAPGCRLHVEAPENVSKLPCKFNVQNSCVTDAGSKASYGCGTRISLLDPLSPLQEKAFTQAHLEASIAAVYRL